MIFATYLTCRLRDCVKQPSWIQCRKPGDRGTLHVERDLVERRRENVRRRREGDEGVVACLYLEDDPALAGQVYADVEIGERRYGRRETSI